ncbi:hypothetical protein J2TS4_04120 [Paenibacillus sp. J2TS4]|nr:hypothetical protein J2TS4_04120 [Paenibacillus sp. J2TS4]
MWIRLYTLFTLDICRMLAIINKLSTGYPQVVVDKGTVVLFFEQWYDDTKEERVRPNDSIE